LGTPAFSDACGPIHWRLRLHTTLSEAGTMLKKKPVMLFVLFWLSGCGTHPDDQQVIDAATKTLRSRIAQTIGTEAAQNAIITADHSSLKAFGPEKWKLLVTIEIQEPKGGSKFDRFMADGLNGTSLITVEKKSGKLDVTGSTREPSLMPDSISPD
jgi:hypothetical protein